MAEKLSDGREIHGGATDVKAEVKLSAKEVKEIKRAMYKDFLQAKQDGKIALEYTFDSWVRDSMNTLRTLRKADIDTEHKLGKISLAEHTALNELRLKMISAIMLMDFNDLDKYGIQFLDPTMAQINMAQAQPNDNRLLVPNHRPGVVKFKKNIIRD